jgi:hypothetical protein
VSSFQAPRTYRGNRRQRNAATCAAICDRYNAKRPLTRFVRHQFVERDDERIASAEDIRQYRLERSM